MGCCLLGHTDCYQQWHVQDVQAAGAVGDMGYNQLVDRLISIMGDATPKALTGGHSLRSTGSVSTPVGLLCIVERIVCLPVATTVCTRKRLATMGGRTRLQDEILTRDHCCICLARVTTVCHAQGPGPGSRNPTDDAVAFPSAAQTQPPAAASPLQTQGPASPPSLPSAAAAGSTLPPQQQPSDSHARSSSADEDAELLSQALALSLSLDAGPAAAHPPPPPEPAPAVPVTAGGQAAAADAWHLVQTPSPPSPLPQTQGPGLTQEQTIAAFDLQHMASQAEPQQHAHPLPEQHEQAMPQPAPSTPSDASAATQAPAEAMLMTPAALSSPALEDSADSGPTQPAPQPRQQPAHAPQLVSQPEAGAVSPATPPEQLGEAAAPSSPGINGAGGGMGEASSSSHAPVQHSHFTSPIGQELSSPSRHSDADVGSPFTPPPTAAAASTQPDTGDRASAKRATELALAEVLHQFLECSQGQLTAHGLVSLQEVCLAQSGLRLKSYLDGLALADLRYLTSLCCTLQQGLSQTLSSDGTSHLSPGSAGHEQQSAGRVLPQQSLQSALQA